MEFLRKLFVVSSPTEVYAATGLHLNVFMYAMAFWLTQPLLPYITKEVGADRLQLGYLQTILEVAQVFSSLYFGQVIDKVGPRYAMTLAQVGTAVSYFLLASAPTINFLYLSRIPTVFMACMLVAQGTIPSLCDPKDRATALGRISVSYMLGMLVGSISGGALSEYYGYSAVGYIAAGTSLLMAFTTLAVFPDTNIIRIYEKKDTKIRLFAALSMSLRKHMRHLVAVILVCGYALSLYKSQFSVIMADHFHISAKEAGYTTALAAAVGLISNTFVVAPLRQYFSSRTLILYSCLVLAVCFVALTLLSTFGELLILMVPVTMASTLLYTVGAAALSNAVDMDETGTAVSISHSLRSLTGVAAPPLGGFLIEKNGLDGLGFTSAGLAVAGSVLFSLLAPTKANKITTSDAQKQDEKKAK